MGCGQEPVPSERKGAHRPEAGHRRPGEGDRSLETAAWGSASFQIAWYQSRGLTPRYEWAFTAVSYTRLAFHWGRLCPMAHRQAQEGEIFLGRKLVGLCDVCGQVVVV